MLRVAGLMSGTSADGVSVAIADIGLRGVRLLAFHTWPYSPALRRRIFALFNPQTSRVDDICHMNFVLGEVFAAGLIRLAAKSGIALSTIDLVGSHGQTIFHIPHGRRFGRRALRSTLQIGEPCVIAERTGITTVADFRPRDIAAGGEGAPLVPYADYVLFHDQAKNRAVQNIGGIANVTWLAAGGRAADIIAFDTGPGNMIMDHCASALTDGKCRYDRNGLMARQGEVHAPLLRELMAHPFLRRRPPKSTGREEFGAQFCAGLLRRARQSKLTREDILATVTAFTARSIARAYRRFLPGGIVEAATRRFTTTVTRRVAASTIDEVILCGGGARNRTLVAMLREELQPARVVLMDEFGISVEAKEALSFAILAHATIRGAANNVPAATGAREPAVLGKIVPARSAGVPPANPERGRRDACATS